MTLARISSGKKGEALAVTFLKKQGYGIIARNYKTKLGEIDIIGKDKSIPISDEFLLSLMKMNSNETSVSTSDNYIPLEYRAD